MNLLVTVIGNAVVDPVFRQLLLEKPAETIDRWGFRLTKGESALVEAMFHKELTDDLRRHFKALEDTLYKKVMESKEVPQDLGRCPFKKCMCSLEYPLELREELKQAA